jgi:sporulation integral membrane protein YtvI
MAAALNPFVKFLDRKFKMSRRWISNILVIIVFAIMAAGVSWLAYWLTLEIVALGENIENILGAIMAAFENVSRGLYWLVDFVPGDNTDAMMAAFFERTLNWLQNTIGRTAEYLMQNTWGIAIGLGNWLIALLMFLLAAGFMTIDFPQYGEKFAKIKSRSFETLKQATKLAFVGYIRSQLLLATLAAVVIYIGIVAIQQPYALVIALVVWILDFLPILGSGTWMVPWSIIEFINGDITKAIYLLALQTAFFIVRRILEPKVMGKQMNLSPLLALVSIYVGMKLAGFWGMIFGPVITIILISMSKQGVFDNTYNDIKAVVADLKGLFGHPEKEEAELNQ